MSWGGKIRDVLDEQMRLRYIMIVYVTNVFHRKTATRYRSCDVLERRDGKLLTIASTVHRQ